MPKFPKLVYNQKYRTARAEQKATTLISVNHEQV